MDSAIRQNRRRARKLRIISPADSRIIRVRGVCVMAMSKLGHNHTDLAEIAACDHRARMTCERIPGVAVINRANPAVLARGAHDYNGILDGGGQGLLAKHVEAGLEERLRDLEMQTVGCCDG